MFSNIILGPLVAIDSLQDIEKHREYIFDKGFIPHILVKDTSHEVFDNFKGGKYEEFKTVAVFITVQYIRAYE
jgi:hypothetical protein